jgi:ABC-type cobalamin transport system ATPase subunit
MSNSFGTSSSRFRQIENIPRKGTFECLELPGGKNPLLGVIPLEALGTSALDTESEVAVQSAIDKLVENKTVVVIAHRLSTVIGADRILVLEKGQVVESGTHEQLLAKNGRYAELWSAQQQSRRWKIAV